MNNGTGKDMMMGDERVSETATQDSPYADEHGLRRVLPEHAVAHAQANFRWHKFRPWLFEVEKAPTPDACGGCGKPESVHPIPWSTIDGYAAGALLVALGLVPDSGRSETPT